MNDADSPGGPRRDRGDDSSRRSRSRSRDASRGSSRGRGRRGRGGGRRGPCPPDILYHATTRQRAERARARGVLEIGGGRPVFLSKTEAQAWQVAHRQAGEPVVLYVDAARARQLRRCRFERNRQGLWQASSVPIGHVLNLRPGFAEQASAGGIPVYFGPDGPELLLIQVARRHRKTWEVAKGKLEPGESPEAAAIREVREEMGLPVDLEIIHHLGYVRYGFTTPDREPRLKTLHMYLMQARERFTEFAPADAEGVCDVGWFTPEAAARAAAHRSLRPLMRRVVDILHRGRLDVPITASIEHNDADDVCEE